MKVNEAMETGLDDSMLRASGISVRYAVGGFNGNLRETNALGRLHLLIFRRDKKIRHRQSHRGLSWDSLEEFSRRLGVALDARVGSLDLTAVKRRIPICGVEGCDCHHLILSTELPPAFIQRLPASFFILKQPSWPVRSILLLVQAAQTDHLALAWGVRMAHASHAHATALAVVPPVPQMFSGLTRMRINLSDVLASDTKLGSAMRHIAQQFFRLGVQADLVLRQGLPETELCRQQRECEHDLVILASAHTGRTAHWLTGEPGWSLAEKIHTPTLIARPQAA